MANGYNPYQSGNLQAGVQQYGDVEGQRIKRLQGILGSQALQGKHMKKIREEIKKVEAAIKKKQKKRGIFGGLLSLGSMFLPPGMGWLAKSLISGLISGGTAASTKDMMKKQKSRIDKLSSGTLADKLIDPTSEAIQSGIDELDPIKSAIEAFALSAISGKVGKKICRQMFMNMCVSILF